MCSSQDGKGERGGEGSEPHLLATWQVLATRWSVPHSSPSSVTLLLLCQGQQLPQVSSHLLIHHSLQNHPWRDSGVPGLARGWLKLTRPHPQGTHNPG